MSSEIEKTIIRFFKNFIDELDLEKKNKNFNTRQTVVVNGEIIKKLLKIYYNIDASPTIITFFVNLGLTEKEISRLMMYDETFLDNHRNDDGIDHIKILKTQYQRIFSEEENIENLVNAVTKDDEIVANHAVDLILVSFLENSLILTGNSGIEKSDGVKRQVEGEELTDLEALKYIASNPDLIPIFGTDIEGAKSHYTSYGKSEGRETDNFDEYGYLASNADLLTAFGTDTKEAIKHYISNGYSEGRVTNNFSASDYLNKYEDLKNAFGDDGAKAVKHYVESGYAEGRDDTGSGNVVGGSGTGNDTFVLKKDKDAMGGGGGSDNFVLKKGKGSMVKYASKKIMLEQDDVSFGSKDSSVDKKKKDPVKFSSINPSIFTSTAGMGDLRISFKDDISEDLKSKPLSQLITKTKWLKFKNNDPTKLTDIRPKKALEYVSKNVPEYNPYTSTASSFTGVSSSIAGNTKEYFKQSIDLNDNDYNPKAGDIVYVVGKINDVQKEIISNKVYIYNKTPREIKNSLNTLINNVNSLGIDHIYNN